MGFRDNRQSKRMLEKMGLNLEEMPDVDEVVIKTKEKDLIIKSPQVSKLKSKGIDMYQIMGNDTEEIIKEESKISEEDVEEEVNLQNNPNLTQMEDWSAGEYNHK